MHVFIDFWKLETENSLLYVFSFFHKLSFDNRFCFLSILGCQTSFLVSKIENCFWKQKIREKIVTKHTFRVRLESAYLVKTEKILLKIL